jgi:DNA-binding MarR family transcriptional regulator
MKAKRTTLTRGELVGHRRDAAHLKSPGDNILALVHTFSNLIGRTFYGSLELRHHLSIHQWRILLTLAHHPGATAVDIIARWALQPMSVSRAIRELTQCGLIVRRIGSSDRRRQELFLTSKGRRVYSRSFPTPMPVTMRSWIAFLRPSVPGWREHLSC